MVGLESYVTKIMHIWSYTLAHSDDSLFRLNDTVGGKNDIRISEPLGARLAFWLFLQNLKNYIEKIGIILERDL